MKVFLTGASGYIGGSLAKRLIENGHSVLGLVRSKEKADQLQRLGIDPVLGSLDDSNIVTEAARAADAVINAASSDHRPVVETVLKALAGTGKPFIQTSGSSIVCDDARGESENSQVFRSRRKQREWQLIGWSENPELSQVSARLLSVRRLFLVKATACIRRAFKFPD